ncbi:hypothetical protein CAPTEDRAFT_209716 [Capitella teleta]|uniref:Neurotransmitter-gated ion-channel ligand-binding domain-containing protein n=1 Tax=Capitella teleta TaxID=283909 RepID=R7TZ32_CAPTE|nr:hypothetical protein CAPTEDRAFT_209716 [Capitella teleta]|eukprot:ELT96205.1 hypothetical protein CAPTEDRAFT_209716 [Capitella teleta]
MDCLISRDLLLGLCLLTQIRGTLCVTETELLDHLFGNNYNRKARPLKDASKNVTVSIELEIKEFQGLDEQAGILLFTGFFEAIWFDEFLQWNTTEYPIDYIALPADQIWLPDFGIANSADSFYQRTFVRDYWVHVDHTGSLRWYAGSTLKTTCSLSVSKFPFDKQTCIIVLENTVYAAAAVDIIPMGRTPFNLLSSDINGLWKIVGYHVTKKFFPNDGYIWPRLIFTLHMERLPAYYLWSILLPCVLLTILTSSIYWLPLESGERISLGITVMLSYFLTLLVLDGYLPVTSLDQPLLGTLVNTMMALATFAVTTSIILSYVLNNYSGRLSPSSRAFFFGFLARVVCMRHCVPKTEELKYNDRDHDVADVTREIRTQKSHSDIEEIRNHLRTIIQRYEDSDSEKAIAEEWKAATRILDCLFFWVNLLVILVSFVFLYVNTA